MSDLTANQIDALLGALREAQTTPASDGAFTANELAAKMRCGVDVARKRIGVLIREGRAVCVRVRRPRIDGQTQLVAAYRLVA